MRVRDLLELPEWQLELLAGQGSTGRPIRRVVTTERLDADRHVGGGDVVLTAMMWRASPADSAVFVAAAQSAGAACLGVSEVPFDGVPADVVDACKRVSLPLFGVPESLLFSTITQRVIERLTVERQGDLAGQLRHRRRLLATLAEGGGLGALLGAFADEHKVACHVLTTTGRSPESGQSNPLGEQVPMLVDRFLAAPHLPFVVPAGGTGGEPLTVMRVGREQSRLTSWILVCAGDRARWPGELDDSVDELITLLEVERERVRESRRARQRSAEHVIRATLAGKLSTAELEGRMAEFGLVRGPFSAVSLSVTPPGDGVACALLEEALESHRGRLERDPVVASIDGEAIALVPTSVEAGGVASGVRTTLQVLAPGLGTQRLAVGVSRPVLDAAEVPGALREAQQARDLAGLTDGAISVLATDEISSSNLLLSAVPHNLRASFRGKVLGPLLEYDQEHGSDLIATLQAFLDADCSWHRCAAELHLHTNSLRYRIRRVEELTGRSLTELSDRVDFYLAFHLG